MGKKSKRTMPKAWAEPQTKPAQQHTRSLGGGAWKWIAALAILLFPVMLTAILVVSHDTSRAAFDKSRVDRKVSTLLAGIAQHGDALGQPTAPVTLQFYGDLECLTTKVWVTNKLSAIIDDFVRRGVLKIEYRSFKTDTINPRVFVEQQTAALAAGAQKKLWNFVETFYHEQGREYTPYATESYLDDIAQQVPGLNFASWRHDRQSGRRSERVVADDRTARTLGFHDTPAFRIGLTGKPLRTLRGSQTVFLDGQLRPVTFINARDVANAIKELLA
ncbi:MAG: DsbA family protein [Solirubrobacteraceae bacterium]